MKEDEHKNLRYDFEKCNNLIPRQRGSEYLDFGFVWKLFSQFQRGIRYLFLCLHCILMMYCQGRITKVFTLQNINPFHGLYFLIFQVFVNTDASYHLDLRSSVSGLGSALSRLDLALDLVSGP